MTTLTFAYNHARDPMNPDDLGDKIQRGLILNTTPGVDINPTQIVIDDPNINEANRSAIQAIIDVYVLTPNFNFDKAWALVPKLVDEPRINTAALTPDAHLQVLLQAAAKYAIRGVIFFDTTAAGDLKYGFTAPAGVVLVRAERVHAIAGGTPAELALDLALPASVALAGTGTTGGYIRFDMILHNGGNAGRFQFQFAQNTATNDTGAIVRAGSYLEWARVA